MFKGLRRLFRLAALLVLLLVGLVYFATNADTDDTSRPVSHAARGTKPRATQERQRRSKPPPIEHQIEDESVSDTPAVYKINMQVSVAKKPNQPQLRGLLQYLFEQARRKPRGVYFPRPNAVYIFAYAEPRYHAGARSSFIGRLMYNEISGDTKPTIDIVTEQLAIMFEPPRKRFGLTEDVRQKVFYKLVEAEDRADKKAGIDDPSRYDTGKADRLKSKYAKRIRKKYKITKKQATQISMEGLQKGWPLPPTE